MEVDINGIKENSEQYQTKFDIRLQELEDSTIITKAFLNCANEVRGHKQSN